MQAELITPTALAAKQAHLFALLQPMERVIVAFSGGADSAYLAWAATQALGANARRRHRRFAILPALSQTRRRGFHGPLRHRARIHRHQRIR